MGGRTGGRTGERDRREDRTFSFCYRHDYSCVVREGGVVVEKKDRGKQKKTPGCIIIFLSRFPPSFSVLFFCFVVFFLFVLLSGGGVWKGWGGGRQFK